MTPARSGICYCVLWDYGLEPGDDEAVNSPPVVLCQFSKRTRIANVPFCDICHTWGPFSRGPNSRSHSVTRPVTGKIFVVSRQREAALNDEELGKAKFMSGS
eukprot:gene6405-biopygen13662